MLVTESVMARRLALHVLEGLMIEADVSRSGGLALALVLIGLAYGHAAGLAAGLVGSLLGPPVWAVLPAGWVAGVVWGLRARQPAYAPSGLGAHAGRAAILAVSLTVVTVAAL